VTILFLHPCLGLPNGPFFRSLSQDFLRISHLCHVRYKVSLEAVPYLRKLVAGFPLRRPEFEPRSGHVAGRVALGQFFSEYFSFPSQFSFHRLLHIHHLSSGTGKIDQLVADVTRGLSVTPPQETKKKKKICMLSQCPTCIILSRYLLLFMTSYYIQHPLLHQP
jgi:hypothetical protein